MLKHRLSALALGVALIAGVAAAQDDDAPPPSPRAALEWFVLNQINSDRLETANPMDRPAIVERVPDSVITEVDISHDGVADWLVDYEDSGMMWCGTGGCLRTLYVSVPDGEYVRAFNDQSLDFAITQRGGETVIDMSVHHVLCNPMNDDCAYSFAWDSALQRLVERPNVRGETLLTGSVGDSRLEKGQQPKPPEDSPEVLKARWSQELQICRSDTNAGDYSLGHGEIASIPDLSGDGVRDWSYMPVSPCAGSGADEEARPAAPAFDIYLSQADGEPVKAFTSEPGEFPSYDIATRPAMLVSNPDCGYGEACRNARLKWDAPSGRFIPAG